MTVYEFDIQRLINFSVNYDDDADVVTIKHPKIMPLNFEFYSISSIIFNFDYNHAFLKYSKNSGNKQHTQNFSKFHRNFSHLLNV